MRGTRRVVRVVVRARTTRGASGRSTLSVGVNWRSAITGTRRATGGTGLHRTSRETSSRNNTLARAVKTNAEGPSIIIFMKDSYELSSL